MFNRRQIVMKALGMVAGGFFIRRLAKWPKYVVTFTASLKSEQDAQLYFGAQRNRWERTDLIQNLNREFFADGRLLGVQKQHSAQEARWQYMFRSESDFRSWKSRMKALNAISEGDVPSGVRYAQHEGWSS